ncbi:MAG TPA: DNA mismatch repair endonuclease MutL [Gammaproteobacteria bacterium]|nr:DNA mismatch repair endonuclease MutL [Gammaproteobacteria bacterium]
MMNRIERLDPKIANQIAAGEVVERPASVLKELLENSLDAEATTISVTLARGGMQLIKVQDNGLGILKEDLPLALARHATSKIKSQQDLYNITSLGFRGEALASIASVSNTKLTSKQKDQDDAWTVRLTHDLQPELLPAAHPDGTTTEVTDLFYNTPARRKFLRREQTEYQHCEEVFKRIALSHASVAFNLKHNDKNVMQLSALVPDQVSRRVQKICGGHFMSNAVSLEQHAVGLHLWGWLGLPSLAKRTADCQYFYINTRYIRDKMVNHAIRSALLDKVALPEGTYPAYVLYLECDPKDVDVNVHPTKHEVRFSEGRLIYDFISKAVREAILALEETRPKLMLDPDPPFSSNRIKSYESYQDCPSKTFETPRTSFPADYYVAQNSSMTKNSNDTYLEHTLDFFAAKTPELKRVFGGHRYFVQENQEGLLILDLKLAAKNLLKYCFEQHKATFFAPKPLLWPLELEIFPAQSNKWMNILGNPIVAELGFGFSLNAKKLRVVTVPPCLCLADPKILCKEAFQTWLSQYPFETREDALNAMPEDWITQILSQLTEAQLKAFLLDTVENPGSQPGFLVLQHEKMALLL